MKSFILYIVMFLCFLAGAVVRFSNPEMTETQLFLNFWYIWIAITFGVIILIKIIGND